MFTDLINPFVWISGSPPPGWRYGLETFWPVVVEGTLVSVALGLIGCFLVVRGMSLLGDALAHSVLPGIVIGFLIGRSMQSAWILIGATIMGMAAAVLVQAVQHHSRVKEDASLGIIFTALFALGVLMINLFAGQSDLDPSCVLYGQIEAFIKWPQKLLPMAIILGALLILLAAFYRHLVVSTFDPLLAHSVGIPATLVHYSLMAALSLTTVASFEAVGAILAVALLITPGATARLWTDRMPRMLALSAVFAVAASVLGYWLSHPAIFNTSASAAMSVAGFGLFLISWLIAPRRGLLSQYSVRRRLRLTMAEENVIKTVHELAPSASPYGVGVASLGELLQMPEWQVGRVVRRAAGKGWASSQQGVITLTPAGHQRAQLLASAHELWEQYLQKEVGVAPDHLHDPAEWVEHYLNEERVEELRATVGKSD